MAKRAQLFNRLERAEGNSIRLAESSESVIGVYRPANTEVGEVGPQHCYNLKKINGDWVETEEPHTATIPLKMERVLRSRKRFIIVIGGRGSGKSITVHDIGLIDMADLGAKGLFLREYQSDISDSTHSLLAAEIGRLGIKGARVTDSTIETVRGGRARFRGLARNPEGLKSAHGFHFFMMDEAQTASEQSLKMLTPTMRTNGGRMFFIANPGSSEDPFSQRFIVPFLSDIQTHGFFEDELHTIVFMNYMDNPWFDEGMESERAWDEDNLSRAMYRHIWLGEFNDSVDDNFIKVEWFDAAIDAHKEMGWKASGGTLAAFDPADHGEDSKAYGERKGSVITFLEDWHEGDINDAADRAIGYAQANHVSGFTWDAVGMGAGLRRQVTDGFKDSGVLVQAFVGSDSPRNKDEHFQSDAWNYVRPVHDRAVPEGDNELTNGDVFENLRAHAYFLLMERFYNTYRAVVKGEYIDPDTMISLDSEGIGIYMAKLRAECCRLPRKRKANLKFAVMDKQTLRSKYKIPSPGMADVLSMLMLAPEQDWRPETDYSRIRIGSNY